MFAVPLGLFALYVPDDLRPRAFGLNAAMWGVSAVIGPALGAALTGTVGWRAVFWINLPLIAIIAWCGLLAMRHHPPRAQDGELRPLNAVGPALLGLVVLALLVEPPAAVVPALLFLFHERRTASPVFTHRPSSLAASVISLSTGAAFIGSEVYLPLELQAGFGHGVGLVGAALLLSTLGWTLGSTTTARLHIPPRRQVVLGTLAVFSGTALMALPLAGAALPMAAYALSGIGMGVSNPPLFAVVLEDVGEGREGQATASVPVARQVGAGIGTAIAGMVFGAVLSERAIKAAEKTGAHVPQVVDGARLSFAAVAAVALLGVVATRWLAGGARRAGAADRAQRAAA
jgi:MFS family permease